MQRKHGTKYVIIGYIVFILGSILLIIVPLEISTYNQFFEGGRFHYPGFGFGSFMFGFISSQVIAYAFVGTLLIIVGYGHIKLYPWAPRITISLLQSWLIVGLPVSCIFLFMLLASKNIGIPVFAICVCILLSSFTLFPYFIKRKYASQKVKAVFINGTRPGTKAEVSIKATASVVLCVFFILFNMLLVLYNCLFPVFGSLKTGKDGLCFIILNIIILLAIIIGTLRRNVVLSWISILYYGALSISILFTFMNMNFISLLAYLDFPDYEYNFLKGIPINGIHIIAITTIPLILEIINRIIQIKEMRAS
jgi:hypothetical protein